MSRKDKLIRRFLAKPADFTFMELNTLLRSLGYKRIATGKSAGSRVAYFDPASGHIIRLHRPHPVRIMRKYQLDLVEEALKARGLVP